MALQNISVLFQKAYVFSVSQRSKHEEQNAPCAYYQIMQILREYI